MRDIDKAIFLYGQTAQRCESTGEKRLHSDPTCCRCRNKLRAARQAVPGYPQKH